MPERESEVHTQKLQTKQVFINSLSLFLKAGHSKTTTKGVSLQKNKNKNKKTKQKRGGLNSSVSRRGALMAEAPSPLFWTISVTPPPTLSAPAENKPGHAGA